MALFTLSRINVCGVGLQKPVTRLGNTASLSLRVTNGSKDLPVRGGRGSPLLKPRRESGEPRTEKMPEDQDWTSVYPAAASFRPGSVPLPVRMGYPVKGGVPPEKKGNLELIKIPNFLHLTPSAIKKHCEALKPFCTEWPSALDTDAKCDKHFPIKVESTDYVSAGLSVRNPSARVVSLKVELSSLKLDEHARKKMIKLVGKRYCKDTDVLTITTDSCPLRKQNKDYAMYLLTVLYHESWVDAMTARQAANGALGLEKYYLCERSIKEEKTEAWEAEKTVADMEEYSWEDSPSQRNILDVLARMECPVEKEGEEVREELLGKKEVQEYRDSVARLKNEGESEATLTQYKEAVKKVLNL